MKQRVLLSAALLHNPDLIIFDEPLSGLDAVTARLFKDLLVMLKREGKAVLYISHVLEVVEQVCDRVVILAGGPHAGRRITAATDADDVTAVAGTRVRADGAADRHGNRGAATGERHAGEPCVEPPTPR